MNRLWELTLNCVDYSTKPAKRLDLYKRLYKTIIVIFEHFCKSLNNNL